MPYRRYRFSTMMARVDTSNGSAMALEVEASSFSVWNCVITFLQIILISTMLYGAGWNPATDYDAENPTFRALAFFFSLWALQAVALAMLLVWAIGKRSYALCHSWILSEILMQLFICLCGIYFSYHTLNERDVGGNDSYLRLSASATTSSAAAAESSYLDDEQSTGMRSVHHYQRSFRPPKHLPFLIMLHFLIKGFGFWIVRRYMRLLAVGTGNDVEAAGGPRNNSDSGAGSDSRDATCRMSPPPSYEGIFEGGNELPCYDEAVKLCSKDSMEENASGTAFDNENDNNNTTCKSALV